ncbi:pyrophosphorylase [Sphaerisporangium krabiense]|uniref:2-C-methyl-D-erythritol 4-phosphate cytidylyltransferase n=1 Tax=Sphaerisporangium krabiense TaxID=763782 RepID=A0A7W8Z022_9ACTN|nr:bifunctional cytidylyltransferase/SDR family oxidoreductase [Sphaerisporangium krabiense]MBB5624690.1 2-C-methyl-D-erythritol 4-phosphate cytidylyltransferase [Sphaerisporangium krabiense]GII61351.1 pyrophosphorylase [Sphaerisporangium krabiense]
MATPGPEPRRRTVGVVLAGGVGQRMGHGTPKQLLRLAGRTIIEHTLAVFEAAPEIDEIVVLMTPGFTAEVEDLVARRGFRKVAAVVEGGATRTESTWRALRALGPGECDVLLHDAVRPLVEPRVIAGCAEALRTRPAIVAAIPSSDTIMVVGPGEGGEVVEEIPDRARLRRVQTPQGFRLSLIRDAYERAFADPDFPSRPATDDCGVVLRYRPDAPIFVVPGSEHNMKVTHPVDIPIAESLLRLVPAALPLPGPGALDGTTVVVFGDAGVAAVAGGCGADVHAFSREDVRVEDAAAVAEALARAAKDAGRVDHVVCGAPDSPADAVAVGHLGALNVAGAAEGYLRESRGHLLLRAPALPPGEPALEASVTGAVTALTEALARAWAPEGVRVNCLRPVRDLAAPRDAARAAAGVLLSDLTGQVVDVSPGV